MKTFFTALLLLWSSVSHAVIAEVAGRKTQIGTGAASDSLAQSVGGTPASGEMIVVMGAADGSNSSIGVTDNRGNSYTVQTFASGVYRLFVAWTVVSATQTVQVLVNPSPTNCRIAYTIDSFTGQHATPLDVGIVGASGTGTAPAVSITPTMNGTLAVGFETEDGASIVQDPPAGWTQMGELNAGTAAPAGNSAFLINTTTAPLTPTWTLSVSQNWIAIAAVFKAADSTAPAAGGGSRRRIFIAE
jgi:hypothetical protein